MDGRYWFIQMANTETVLTVPIVANGDKQSYYAVLAFREEELANEFIEYGANKPGGARVGTAVCREDGDLESLLDRLQEPAKNGRPACKFIVINPETTIWEPTHFPSPFAEIRKIKEFRRACEDNEADPEGTL
jgi:hypothetical protein